MNPEKYISTLKDCLDGLDISHHDFMSCSYHIKRLGGDKNNKKEHERKLERLRMSFYNDKNPSTRADNAKIRLREKLAQKKFDNLYKG